MFDLGKNFGKTGAVENWWSEETSNEYAKVKQCYKDALKSYSKLYYGGEQYNSIGNVISNEDIAFIEGYKLALAAYRKQLPKKEQALPGLENLNGEQLFTLGFTQVSNFECLLPTSDRSYTITNQHSMQTQRSIGNCEYIHFVPTGNQPSGMLYTIINRRNMRKTQLSVSGHRTVNMNTFSTTVKDEILEGR